MCTFVMRLPRCTASRTIRGGRRREFRHGHGLAVLEAGATTLLVLYVDTSGRFAQLSAPTTGAFCVASKVGSFAVETG